MLCVLQYLLVAGPWKLAVVDSWKPAAEHSVQVEVAVDFELLLVFHLAAVLCIRGKCTVLLTTNLPRYASVAPGSSQIETSLHYFALYGSTAVDP